MALENSQLYVIYRNHTRFLRYPDFCVEVRISTKKLHSTENLISLILDAACPLCQFNNACCTDNVVQQYKSPLSAWPPGHAAATDPMTNPT